MDKSNTCHWFVCRQRSYIVDSSVHRWRLHLHSDRQCDPGAASGHQVLAVRQGDHRSTRRSLHDGTHRRVRINFLGTSKYKL